MPRPVPDLVGRLTHAAGNSLALAAKAEQVRVELARVGSSVSFPELQLFSLYEVAYLRLFVAWEDFLDRAFVYYLCGRSNSVAPEALVAGQLFCSTIAEAEARLYGQQDYLLWHNPATVQRRASVHFQNGGLSSAVIASALTSLINFSAVRHRIAHGHEDSRRKFDLATMSMSGRRFAAGRPGRFLRSQVANANPPIRWIEEISGNLVSLSRQIVP